MAAERAGLLDSVAMPPPRAHPHPHAHAHAAPIVPVPLIPVVTEVPVQSKGQCDEQSDSEASCRSTPPGDAVASSSSTRDDVSGRDSGSEDGRRRSVGSDGESGDNASSSSSHAAPPSSKRRRRDKTVSRLSFSDELGDGSENEDLRERLSMSTATNKRCVALNCVSGVVFVVAVRCGASGFAVPAGCVLPHFRRLEFLGDNG
eukprot:3688787-Rhodomonas_salina.1